MEKSHRPSSVISLLQQVGPSSTEIPFLFLMQVHQLQIDYAKSAKRLDVKKLKMKMWQIITENIPDGKGDSPDDKENTVPVSYQTASVHALCLLMLGIDGLIDLISYLVSLTL